MLSLEISCFRKQARPWETFKLRSSWRSGFPPTPTFVYLSQDSHNEIYNIYDKHMHLQPPFQSLYE
jgi:hypothetical protein